MVSSAPQPTQTGRDQARSGRRRRPTGHRPSPISSPGSTGAPMNPRDYSISPGRVCGWARLAASADQWDVGPLYRAVGGGPGLRSGPGGPDRGRRSVPPGMGGKRRRRRVRLGGSTARAGLRRRAQRAGRSPAASPRRPAQPAGEDPRHPTGADRDGTTDHREGIGINTRAAARQARPGHHAEGVHLLPVTVAGPALGSSTPASSTAKSCPARTCR
jgi:hypothetical protein